MKEISKWVDKDKGEIPWSNEKWTRGDERTSPLDQVSQISWERKKREERKRREIEKERVLEREAPPSLYDSRRSDRRIPTRQGARLLSTARTTRGYQFRGVSTNSGKGRGFSPTCFTFRLRVM